MSHGWWCWMGWVFAAEFLWFYLSSAREFRLFIKEMGDWFDRNGPKIERLTR